MMKQSLRQQVILGVIIVITIVVTLLGGVILALSEVSSATEGEDSIGETDPSATTFLIPTLPATATLLGAGSVDATATETDTEHHADSTQTEEATGEPTESTEAPPTASPSSSPIPSPTTSSGECQIAEGWVTYTVQPGENMFRIGLRFGVSVEELLRGNCRTSFALSSGETIYVPPVTPVAVPTLPAGESATLVPTGTQTASDGNCTQAGVFISFPSHRSVVSGTIQIAGAATLSDFSFYRLEIRSAAESPDSYATFTTGDQQVSNGLLAEFDTTVLPNGDYWIRLTVINLTGNYPERCARMYTFDN